MANWEPDEEGVSLAEKACAISTGTGYIMVTYEFPNFSLWKQKRGVEDDHFFMPVPANVLRSSGQSEASGKSVD